jgi:hypothetical protein
LLQSSSRLHKFLRGKRSSNGFWNLDRRFAAAFSLQLYKTGAFCRSWYRPVSIKICCGRRRVSSAGGGCIYEIGGILQYIKQEL